MKKWRLTYNALRRLTEEGTVVEFCCGDDDDEEYREGDIARVSLEGLALTGEGFDSEYGIRYYTAERLADEDYDYAARLGIAPAEP